MWQVGVVVEANCEVNRHAAYICQTSAESLLAGDDLIGNLCDPNKRLHGQKQDAQGVRGVLPRGWIN